MRELGSREAGGGGPCVAENPPEIKAVRVFVRDGARENPPGRPKKFAGRAENMPSGQSPDEKTPELSLRGL